MTGAAYKKLYNPILLGCLALSIALHMGLYYANPRPAKEKEYVKERIISIEVVEVPPTQQEQEAPPPIRPQVPIEAEDDMDVEDVTIMDTDLDPEARLEAPDMVAPMDEEPIIVEYWAIEEVPVPTHQVVPSYPEIARQATMEGTVFVRMLVGTSGLVEKVEVIRGPKIFHRATIDAAMQMRFSPAKQNGRAVRVWVSKPFKYQLN